MMPWMLATLALLPAFAIPAIAACRGGSAARIVAVQLAGAVAALVLVLMSFAFDQRSFVDIALALVFLSLPGHAFLGAVLRALAVKAILVDGLLVVAVLGAWLGCLGFARLRAPLDRIHCVAFVNVVSGTAILLAGFASDGVSVRSLKILFLVGVALVSGAAMSHAVGRALLLREQGPGQATGEAL